MVPKAPHEGFKSNAVTVGEYGDISVEGLQVKAWLKMGIYEYKLCMVVALLFHRMYLCNRCDV